MTLESRIAALDWARITAELDGFGAAATDPLLLRAPAAPR
jgi:hypothetical protein